MTWITKVLVHLAATLKISFFCLLETSFIELNQLIIKVPYHQTILQISFFELLAGNVSNEWHSESTYIYK